MERSRSQGLADLKFNLLRTESCRNIDMKQRNRRIMHVRPLSDKRTGKVLGDSLGPQGTKKQNRATIKRKLIPKA